MNFKFKAFVYKSKIILSVLILTLSIFFFVIPSFYFMSSCIIPFVNAVTTHYSLNSINSRYLFRSLTMLEASVFVPLPFYIFFKIYLKRLILIIDNNTISVKSDDKYILNTNLNKIESILFKKISNTAYIIEFTTISKVLILRSSTGHNINDFTTFSEELKKSLLSNNWAKIEKYQKQTFFKHKLENQLFIKKEKG